MGVLALAKDPQYFVLKVFALAESAQKFGIGLFYSSLT